MILAFLLAAAVPPHPAQLKTFQDWTVGCDNGAACHAVALMPENWPDDALTMSVRRGPEPGAEPVLAFELGADSNAASIIADGKRLAVRLAGSEGQTKVVPADTPIMIAALRSANRIELQSADGKPLGVVSLKGASAALLYMDEKQRRTGTATALVRPGTRPMPASPPMLPVVTAAPVSSARPLALTPAALAALRRKHGCTLDEVGGPEEAETATMTPAASLLLLACGSGAYNVSYVPFILRRGRRGVEATIAAFDLDEPWWKDEGRPVLINAAWDGERGLLTTLSKGRGLADCGTTTEHAWDGARFRLVEQAEMTECRGSTDYITTWRARVVRK